MIKYKSTKYSINSFIKHIVNSTSFNDYVLLYDKIYFQKFFEGKRINKKEPVAFNNVSKTNSYSEFCNKNLEEIDKSLKRLSLIINHNNTLNKDISFVMEYLYDIREKKEFIENLSWDMLLDIEKEEKEESKIKEKISEEVTTISDEIKGKITEEAIIISIGLKKEILDLYNPFKFRKNIFISEEGYKLFDYFAREINEQELDKTAYKSDLCYLYRKMIEDKFMHPVPHKVYNDFLAQDYNLPMDKIRQIYQVNSSKRIQNYDFIKRAFKLH